MLSGMANDTSLKSGIMACNCTAAIGAIWVVTRLCNRPYVYNRQGAIFYFFQRAIMILLAQL